MELIKHLTHAEQVLTAREIEVFILLGKGIKPTEIGKILNISPKTVSTHRGTIMRKMGFESTYELMHYVIKNIIINSKKD